MKRMTRFAGFVLVLIASGTIVLAQDAAAPFRRPSPSPAEATPPPEPAQSPREEKEEPPSPREEEEPPRRAEAVATSTPSEAPRPAATPEPAAQPQPASAPAATPTRKVLQGERVRAVEPRPAGSRRPRPAEDEDGPGRGESSPRTQIGRGAALDYWDEDPGSAVKNLERRWQKALMNKDVETIDELLASDFVATSSTGRVGSKSTLLNTIRRDKNEYKSATARAMSVRMLGPRVAVVTGIAAESGTTPDGRRFNNSRRFTDTWMLRNKKWVCVASQATEVPKG